MKLKHYKCWVVGEDETSDDAHNQKASSHEEAARDFVDENWSEREWYAHIDNDPIVVHVAESDGETPRVFKVRLATTIDVYADEVTE